MDNDIKIFVIGVLVLMLVCTGVGLLVLFRKDEPSVVKDKMWYRAIQVLRYQTVQEEDWNIPDGGRMTGSYRAVHHYDHVRTGSHSEDYPCQTPRDKSKRCSRTVDEYDDVPVYRTRYKYDIERWVYNRSFIAQGHANSPAWADATDITEGGTTPKIGDETLGARIESYTIFVPEGFQLPLSEWETYGVGDTVIVTRNLLGHVMVVMRKR